MLGTPIDVICEQSLLTKVLSDDTWRQSAMRNNVTSDASDGLVGVEMADESTDKKPHAVGNYSESRSKANNTAAVVTMTEALTVIINNINADLGQYAELLVDSDISPELLGEMAQMAADTHMCMTLGISARDISLN